MSGRVTQSMLSSQLLRNLNANMYRMDRIQEKLATTKRINRPSDDPVGISFTMRYRSELSTNEQYQTNVNSALSWLENTDTTLDQVGAIFHKARALATQAANGTNSTESLDAIRDEVLQLKEQLIDIANSHFNGKYVFNGQMTDVKPYDPDPLVNTDNGIIEFEIGVGVKIGVNVIGNDVFGTADAPDNAFRVLDDMVEALNNDDYDEITTIIGRIDSRFDAILSERSGAGAKYNRLELAEERLQDIYMNVKMLQSKTEDADMAELFTEFSMAKNVFQASLSVGANLIRPSLIDFLR